MSKVASPPSTAATSSAKYSGSFTSGTMKRTFTYLVFSKMKISASTRKMTPAICRGVSRAPGCWGGSPPRRGGTGGGY
jgi:hypothetical protein